jgi:hypothetical protein
LERLLAGSDAPQVTGSSPYEQLDALYGDILEAASLTASKDAVVLMEQLKTIVGSIVLLEEELSEKTSTRLLGLNEEEAKITIRRLFSLLLMTPNEPNETNETNEPIRIFHPSSPDYWLDWSKGSASHIERDEGHRTLAHRCLVVINE